MENIIKQDKDLPIGDPFLSDNIWSWFPPAKFGLYILIKIFSIKRFINILAICYKYIGCDGVVIL